MTLGEFLESQMGAAGQWNCSTMPADWCIALGHPDFAAEWRNVTDPDECEELPREAGGLAILWERGIGNKLPSFEPTGDAGIYSHGLEPGDIAVVAALGLETGGIWTGTRWGIRRQRGIGFFPPEALIVRKAWRP
jgi:hypothetical protein